MNKRLDEIVAAIKEMHGDEFDVSSTEAIKTNGVKLTGVSVYLKESAIRPIVYVDEALRDIEAGSKTVKEVAEMVFASCLKGSEDVEDLDIPDISRESVLATVYAQVINAERNKERLASVPHKDLLDLAVVYRCSINDKNQKEAASFLVDSKTIRNYGITIEELDEAARSNTEAKGFVYRHIAEALGAIVAGHEFSDSGFTLDPEDFRSSTPLYVLSRKDGFNGASILLYRKYFDALADALDSDLYVLPSSIHEVIAIPASEDVDPKAMLEMVVEINSQVVSDDDFLADNVYFYSREKGEVEFAEIA